MIKVDLKDGWIKIDFQWISIQPFSYLRSVVSCFSILEAQHVKIKRINRIIV
jgi:hypothetical protein